MTAIDNVLFFAAIAGGIYIGYYVAWIRSEYLLLVDCCAPIILGSAMIGGGLLLVREKFQILNTPISKARGVSKGIAAFSGHGFIEQKIVDPVWHQTCSWWRYILEETQQSSNGAVSVVIQRQMSPESLYLEDNSGRILIKTDSFKARFYPIDEYDFPLDAPRNTVLSALDSNRFDPKWLVTGFVSKLMIGGLRLKIQIIRPKDTLFVYGEVTPDGTLVSSSARAPLILSTDPERKFLRTFGWKFYALEAGGLAIILAFTSLTVPFDFFSAQTTGAAIAASFFIGLALINSIYKGGEIWN